MLCTSGPLGAHHNSSSRNVPRAKSVSQLACIHVQGLSTNYQQESRISSLICLNKIFLVYKNLVIKLHKAFDLIQDIVDVYMQNFYQICNLAKSRHLYIQS